MYLQNSTDVYLRTRVRQLEPYIIVNFETFLAFLFPAFHFIRHSIRESGKLGIQGRMEVARVDVNAAYTIGRDH